MGIRSGLKCLLHTAPLMSLCSFEYRGRPIITHVLPWMDIYIPEVTLQQMEAHPTYSDTRVVLALIESQHITPLVAPNRAIILEVYPKLGRDERAIIRLGLTRTDYVPVLDDMESFVVACRCGLLPMDLPDVLVELVMHHDFEWQLGRDIIGVWMEKKRYQQAHLRHMIDKLEDLT